MDLASLTRPAILTQCIRCSSSLAVLENEWAKLSNSYSIAAAWQSVNLHRISVSSERKQIPQTSDMSMLRGRIIQEITCKLCQQKLGVLCGLDNGTNILWKMSKVSFREIVTMRTAEPIFKDEALERLCPPKEPPAENAIPYKKEPWCLRALGTSIRWIPRCNNKCNIKDGHSFTSLRIELNGPNRHPGEHGPNSGPGFDMIATVLKELKSKSDEIEKLKLEIEALKLKNRFMEDRRPSDHYSSQMNVQLPEVKSPGLLQAGRKRAWPDAFSNGRHDQVADSFDEEEMVDDFSLADLPIHPARAPLKDSQATEDGHRYGQLSTSPPLRIESRRQSLSAASNTPQGQFINPDQSPAKRQRITQPVADAPNPAPSSTRGRGRPRKSVSHSNLKTPHTAPPSQQLVREMNDTSETSPVTIPRGRGRPRRSVRPHSVGPSGLKDQTESVDTNQTPQDSRENRTNSDSQKNGDTSNMTSNGIHNSDFNGNEEVVLEEQRRAKVAARDVMTKLALEREEAMETDNSR
ncbi:NADH-ubiquinone oxidoreductase subunit [Penicillium atrosanguineum]|uniref:NADH-ubiquinone oxidoreductase subunit n=1 Tax=Penicillium atrosanguineum TaxID=1132637 RepID=UPI00239F84EA|nr:NADH-ubiquinone oxidoreductase subunit [Penicillium atrosanguineum]KAJ5310859.1 NADH-ubiquinone oxidoreductase subunit [Penicillium atrosanguineum]